MQIKVADGNFQPGFRLHCDSETAFKATSLGGLGRLRERAEPHHRGSAAVQQLPMGHPFTGNDGLVQIYDTLADVQNMTGRRQLTMNP